ncbi:hypothetical protein PENTCL1PPCAC_24314, partial [Pristionchus entomophagus]
ERQQQALISELRRENEQGSSSRFSRACGVCFAEAPQRRAVFAACGHALCRACAEQLKAAADAEAAQLDLGEIDWARPLACPFCRKEGGFVPLFEDVMEDEGQIATRMPRVPAVPEVIDESSDAEIGEDDEVLQLDEEQLSDHSEQLDDYKEEERVTLAPGSVVCRTCGYCSSSNDKKCLACETRLPRMQ